MSSNDILTIVNDAFSNNGGDPRTSCSHGQFSNKRYAHMFLPGIYNNLDIPVGYYTSVYGLGKSPLDTIFSGGKGVYCEEACGLYGTGALDTFWRSAENFYSTSNYGWAVGNGMSWVVSQAAPLRNVKVDNDLLLFEYLPEYCCDAGYASGGWISGLEVGGTTKFGSQQQFMVRNSQSNKFDLPVWNGVFAAVNGAPSAQCGQISNGQSANASISVLPTVPLVAEKPYITSTDGKTFKLIVPTVQTNVPAGVTWTSTGFPSAKEIDFSNVYVTQTTDTSSIINEKLSQGLNVVITPAIYTLDDSLYVQYENQVILGLGLATLIAPSNGSPCIRVADVSGVRIAGLLLEAGKWETKGGMLQVGSSGKFQGTESNPVVITDVFARVGGPNTGVGPVDTMFSINSGYTIIDNTWLWRADHTAEGLVYHSDNPVKNGLVVNSDNVYAYGLASEHTTEDNVVWNGNNGLTYFYQAEIMYDYTNSNWPYSCYKIGSNVDSHTASGLGCYTYFRDASVYTDSGITTNGNKNVKIDKAVSVWLNGNQLSGLNNVIDLDGKKVDSQTHVQYHCAN
mmetsp:Transcript_11578/g.11949  ORF Transcript_11578/g.11949 Transcript_11578/m.11949 type:complete len:566 (+) Transcript_11578:200-1897(+)